MNHKEEAALKKCSERIKKDLDPTYAFLHSLVVDGVVTHDEMETIMALPTREARVTKLLTILPRRGPNAFIMFRNLLKNDYDWLAVGMDAALKIQSKKSSEEEVHKNLTMVVNKRLVPLVLSGNNSYADHRDHISQTIHKIGNLANLLEQKVYKVLDMSEKPKKNVSIERLIEEKLRENTSDEPLVKENQELKKRLKQDEKLRKENEELKSALEIQKKKVKELQKVVNKGKNENTTLRKKNEKLLKDIEALEWKNQHSKKEPETLKSGCEIEEMF